MKNKTLAVITGPTGSGKTALAIEVAEHFGSPVISADSRQIYCGMAIGTAQPTESELARVPHYFIATHDITESYNAGRYEKEALELLERLFVDLDVVVMAGGSGLYIDAVCNGFDPLPDADPELRQNLTAKIENGGMEPLLEQLQRLDPDYFEQVDRNNPQRVIRAVEVCLLSGKPYSQQRRKERAVRDFNIIKIGTQMPREHLYKRIDARVDQMLDMGLERESMELYPYRRLNSLQTVGYREMFDYFDGTITFDQAVEAIKRNSRRYAKRQVTWMGRDRQITLMSPDDTASVVALIEKRIEH